MRRTPFSIRGLIIGAGVFLLLQTAGTVWPWIPNLLFSRTAARLSALFLGVPWETGPGGEVALIHPFIDIAVNGVCSGYTFFCLTSALLVYLVLAHRGAAARRYAFLLILPGIFVLTTLTNTARIVCSVYARLLCSPRFNSSFADAVHLAVGVATFLTVLIFTYLSAQRRLQYVE